MGYFTTLKEKTLNETFPFVKAKLHSGKKKTLDYVSSLYYSKRAPIEKYGEECEDIEKIWDGFVDAFVGTLHAQGGAGCASRAPCFSDGDDGKGGGTKEIETRNRRTARERVVTIGDLHGDLEQTKRAFRACHLTDSKDKWIGGKTTVVQVGDQLDRGPDEVAVMYFLERVA